MTSFDLLLLVSPLLRLGPFIARTLFILFTNASRSLHAVHFIQIQPTINTYGYAYRMRVCISHTHSQDLCLVHMALVFFSSSTKLIYTPNAQLYIIWYIMCLNIVNKRFYYYTEVCLCVVCVAAGWCCTVCRMSFLNICK